MRPGRNSLSAALTDAILYGEENNNIFIRALGRVTLNICYELRDRIFSRLGEQPPVGDIFLDLSRCDYMDSTFMGIILGINKKLKKITEAGLTVVCPTAECSSLFSGLNILKLFTVRESLVTFPARLETISVFEKPGPDIVLRAHDELAEISDANADKFRVLREMLKKRVIEERRKTTERNIDDEDEPDDPTIPEAPEIILTDE
jgi:anti-anti-sigma factor